MLWFSFVAFIKFQRSFGFLSINVFFKLNIYSVTKTWIDSYALKLPVFVLSADDIAVYSEEEWKKAETRLEIEQKCKEHGYNPRKRQQWKWLKHQYSLIELQMIPIFLECYSREMNPSNEKRDLFHLFTCVSYSSFAISEIYKTVVVLIPPPVHPVRNRANNIWW